jgi:hypothetical protein
VHFNALRHARVLLSIHSQPWTRARTTASMLIAAC